MRSSTFVIYWSWPVSYSASATTYPPFFVFVRPSCKGDEGLLQHELVHVEQFWRQPFTFYFMRLFSKTFRYECEIEAYRMSVRYWPLRLDNFALIISAKYGVAFDEVKKRLQG